MESYKFGSEIIHLPRSVNKLCEQGLLWADLLRGDASDEKIDAMTKPILKLFVEASRSEDQSLPDLGFDPFNILSYPFELIEDKAPAERFKTGNEAADNLASLMFALPESDQGLPAAILIVLLVVMISDSEKHFLSEDSNVQDKALAKFDNSVDQLHTLISTFKVMDSGVDVLASNFKKYKGAKKGGQAKADKTKDLKETVLQEAQERYADIPATKAALQIYEKLAASGNWLEDDNGRALLTEPITTFVRWIREAKKQTVH